MKHSLILLLTASAALAQDTKLSWTETPEFSLSLGYRAGMGISNAAPREYFTCVGYLAGADATYACRPTFIGFEAGRFASGASYSVMVGTAAGANAFNGYGTTLLGYSAGRNSEYSDRATMVGLDAGRHAKFATSSVFVGCSSGIAANGSELVYVGFEAGATNSSQLTNAIAIGPRATVDASNQAVIGNPKIIGTTLYGRLHLPSSLPPENSNAPGLPGEISWSPDYIYICTATNHWKRAAIHGSW